MKFIFKFFVIVLLIALIIGFVYFRWFMKIEFNLSDVQENSLIFSILMIFLNNEFFEFRSFMTEENKSRYTKTQILFILPQLFLIVFNLKIEQTTIDIICIISTSLITFLPFSVLFKIENVDKNESDFSQ